MSSMEMESCVPPGFRFHPTEEELVGYYLQRKVNSMKIDIDVIVDIDLYRMEPWDIEGRCKLGYEEQTEWYFFSHKDRKYPTGTRTNRATTAGFWKATGRDKAVLSKSRMIGMRKTLVFYKGRAPNGRKTDWIMHEYRLQSSEIAPPQEEGWVVCRAFKKPSPTNQRQGFEAWNHVYYVKENGNFKPPSYPDMVSSMQAVDPSQGTIFHQLAPLASDQDLYVSTHTACHDSQLVELPQLESPSISTSFAAKDVTQEHNIGIGTQDYEDERCNNHGKQFVDWKNLESLLAPEVTEQASFTRSNFPLIPHEYDLNIHNQVSHLFGSFPDS